MIKIDNNKLVRLQRWLWHKMKLSLIPVYEEFFTNSKGHVCGYYADMKTGQIYYHWLNNDEIDEYNKKFYKDI